MPKGKIDKNICISGPTATDVISARYRIETISNELRKKHMMTHFISFPLISDEIKTNFKRFQVTRIVCAYFALYFE